MEFDRIPSFKDNRCRACTTEEGNMISLSDGHNSELFSKCTSLEIVQSDELPNYICCECFIELESVHRFREKCLMSDLQMRSEILKLKSLAFELEPLEFIVIKDEVLPNEEISFSDEHINECESKDFPLIGYDDFTCDINIEHGDIYTIIERFDVEIILATSLSQSWLRYKIRMSDNRISEKGLWLIKSEPVDHQKPK